MSKFDEILNGASAKVDAEKKMAQEKVNQRAKVLREFAMPIYEFIAYLNDIYPKVIKEDEVKGLFTFSRPSMSYQVGEMF